ncbi:ABC transporter permease [Terrimonas pollutisoli]|uniref:ABC transporter permease n=1 Tax=Terrimonas pollutisoli TaxID=3034147 RepID=UPI0023EABFE8|nr:ABC transporter permease [Terrimonas sp. H1YJ31]
MNKTLLIIQREYLTRVRKKTFIISTILFPILYLGLIFGMGYLGAKSKSRLKVAVVDSSGYFDKGRIERENQKDSSSILTVLTTHVDSLKKNFSEWGYDGYVVIPQQQNWESGIKDLLLHTSRTMGEDASGRVENKLNNIWNEIKNEKLGIDEEKKAIIKNSTVSVRSVNVNDEKANSSVASTIGYVAGFLIYFILLVYGSQVMMGVMEEKTNRIAEVIVSSVKPFQLMLGKIIGIGLVALTQFFLWVAFIFIIYNITSASGSSMSSMSMVVGGIQKAFGSINVPMILFGFVFYFLGGFFFYSSLYAAIGSAVNEDMREAQSLSFPITLLVIFSIAMMSVAINDPTGPVAVWGSIIPFSSPIIMMARIPFGVPGTVPWWQLALSMTLLIAGFIFSVWLSGKIYRTGILMYGKKPSWKEMIKWAFKKS